MPKPWGSQVWVLVVVVDLFLLNLTKNFSLVLVHWLLISMSKLMLSARPALTAVLKSIVLVSLFG